MVGLTEKRNFISGRLAEEATADYEVGVVLTWVEWMRLFAGEEHE